MDWRRFAIAFGAAGLLVGALLLAVPILFDPYGLRAGPGRPQGPLMDLNQRYMYPQVVRSHAYDSAVIGTSTARLLDPEQLGAALGGRFANLAMNAATPWEQMRMAALFRREVPRPRTLVFGIDQTWCEADADMPAKQLTARSFPPWLYEPRRSTDWLRMTNMKSIEIALRVAAYRMGRQPERIRRDGYEVFTPPEGSYVLARAQGHIWSNGGPRPRPVASGEPQGDASLAFPALAWLGDFLAGADPATRVLILLPPSHVASQPLAGSPEAKREAACKAKLIGIAGPHATIVDMRFPSSITREDANYWDPLHYRLPIAARITEILAAAPSADFNDAAARRLGAAH